MSIFMFPVTSIQSASIDDESGDGSDQDEYKFKSL